eukprot:m.126107 g.126107  ORF g.126107 m.126107 type:complete len:111 (+) comp37891_c0_seq5:323-655(+)
MLREIEDVVKDDMTTWDNSTFWPLSSYGCIREKPCIGDLEEHSFEEIRWEAYKAKATGSVVHYEQSLSQLILGNKVERQSIRRMEGKIKEQIVSVKCTDHSKIYIPRRTL